MYYHVRMDVLGLGQIFTTYNFRISITIDLLNTHFIHRLPFVR